MSLCYSPIPSDDDHNNDDTNGGQHQQQRYNIKRAAAASIVSTNSPYVLRPDSPDLATLYRANDDTPLCSVQHPYSKLNTKITHASVVEDDDEPQPNYLFIGYDLGVNPRSKDDRRTQLYNAAAVLGWDCRTGEVIDSIAIPGAYCMYVRASSTGMVAATTIYERFKPRKSIASYRPQTTIYSYVYADGQYRLFKPIVPRAYRSTPVAIVTDSTCARFIVVLTKNGRLLHQHLLGPSISTEVTALKDGPGPQGAELALLNDDMTGILLERSRPRVVVFIAEARYGVEVLQQVDLRAVMEASGQNFSKLLLSSGALLPHFGGEGFAVLWNDNYVYFDMYSDSEGVRRASQKTRTVASLKRPTGVDIVAVVPTTVHWLNIIIFIPLFSELSDGRLLWRWWSPAESFVKEETTAVEQEDEEDVKKEEALAATAAAAAAVKTEPTGSHGLLAMDEPFDEQPDYGGALREGEEDDDEADIISLSDSIGDVDSVIEIIESPHVIDLDAVEGGVALEVPWQGAAIYPENEDGVILLDDEDLEDDRAPAEEEPAAVDGEYGRIQGDATTLELPPQTRCRYTRGKATEFSPLSVSTAASSGDEHAQELWARAQADEAMGANDKEDQDWAAVHWPDVFEMNQVRRKKLVDRLLFDIEAKWTSTLCLRPKIPPLLESDIEEVGKCFQQLARRRGPALILDVRQSTTRERHLFLSSIMAGSLLIVGDDDEDKVSNNGDDQEGRRPSSGSSSTTDDDDDHVSSHRDDGGEDGTDYPVKMFKRIAGVSWEKTRTLAAQMCYSVTAFSDYEQRSEIFARVHRRHLQTQKADSRQGYKHYWWIRCDRCGKYRRAPYYIAKRHGVENDSPQEFHCGLLQQKVEGKKHTWKHLTCEDPPDEADSDEDEQLEAQRYDTDPDTDSLSSDTNAEYDSEQERRRDKRYSNLITARRRHQKERAFEKKINVIKKNLRKWNKKVSKAEAEEIEKARKERAKYAGNDDIDDDDDDEWAAAGSRPQDGRVDGRQPSSGSGGGGGGSRPSTELNTSGASSTTRADTSSFSIGGAAADYESDSEPDNDFGDLPSDPEENEELKRLAGRILRVHMSSLNSYCRFGRRPQRKKPSAGAVGGSKSQPSKAAVSKKATADNGPQKVLTTVMNASSEDAPWETVFMTEVADNKNLKDSVKDDLIKMLRVLTDELANGGSLPTLRRCLQVGRAVKRWIPEEAASWKPIRKVASELVFIAREQMRELTLKNSATAADILLMPPTLGNESGGVRRHRPEGDVSNTMHNIIQGIARDADEAANSRRNKLRRVGERSQPSGDAEPESHHREDDSASEADDLGRDLVNDVASDTYDNEDDDGDGGDVCCDDDDIVILDVY
ncbi:AP-3 complex subunit mu-2 [Perkinsus chesapeaki]|uniref:AP-3 complex subunit mu-2 n=1 Tax=Perkinsus chesapeaki TaxID=330153 RepID=A0A7J6MQL5_PERCH|nr:AP-3 complex subunit mu-2 [Perkinsus chesapeaki]